MKKIVAPIFLVICVALSFYSKQIIDKTGDLVSRFLPHLIIGVFIAIGIGTIWLLVKLFRGNTSSPSLLSDRGQSSKEDKWSRIWANQDISSLACGLVLYTAIFIAGTITGNWLIAIALIVGHFYLSIEEISPHEWGALLFWGSAIKQLDNAPVYACKPFFTTEKEVRTVFQGVIGTPTTNKKGEVVDISGEGTTIIREEEPFRVTFPAIEDLVSLQPEDNYPPELRIPEVPPEIAKAFKGHPLHGNITCDPQMVFWFDIARFINYLKVVPDVKTLSHNITALAKATLQECAGKMTVGMLISYNELVCRRITYRVEQLIGEPNAPQSKNSIDWGVNFRGIQISSMGFPKTLNESMRTARSASYLKDSKVTESEGEKQVLINEGDGTAHARQKLLEAEAAGANALANVASNGASGELVLKLQALERALEKANFTLLPTGELSVLGSLLTGGRAILEGNKPKKP